MSDLQRANVNGGTIEYRVQGSGEPVVLIHAAYVADSFKVMSELSPMEPFRVLQFRKRGYGGSSAMQENTSFATHADDAIALMDHVGIRKAHIVAHCFGGPVGLELALRFPARVQSLALLEPALPLATKAVVKTSPLEHLLATGDPELAFWAQAIELLGERSVPVLRALGFWEGCVAFYSSFARESEMMGSWSFTQEDAAKLDVPILLVLGDNSRPYFREIHDIIKSWFRRVTEHALPDAGHLLQIENPVAMAAALAAFFRRDQENQLG